MPPNSQNPYDFILQDKPKAKRQVLPSGKSTQSRVLVIALGLVGLIVLGIALMAVLSAGGNAATEKLTLAATDQAEILRVATVAGDKAQGRDAKSLAITAQLTMATDQSTMITTLKKLGKKTSVKQLVSSSASQDDTTLNTAEQAGQFDTAFILLIKQLVANYQHDLRLASASAGVNTKDTINSMYDNAQTLVSAK